MCIFLLKQTVSYYVNKDTPVFSAFLDASKAFDRTSHNLLFAKLIMRNVPCVLQPLRWCCVDCVIHHERDVREEQHHTYMWREQAIKESSWRGSSADINL